MCTRGFPKSVDKSVDKVLHSRLDSPVEAFPCCLGSVWTFLNTGGSQHHEVLLTAQKRVIIANHLNESEQPVMLTPPRVAQAALAGLF